MGATSSTRHVVAPTENLWDQSQGEEGAPGLHEAAHPCCVCPRGHRTLEPPIPGDPCIQVAAVLSVWGGGGSPLPLERDHHRALDDETSCPHESMGIVDVLFWGSFLEK